MDERCTLCILDIKYSLNGLANIKIFRENFCMFIFEILQNPLNLVYIEGMSKSKKEKSSLFNNVVLRLIVDESCDHGSISASPCYFIPLANTLICLGHTPFSLYYNTDCTKTISEIKKKLREKIELEVFFLFP
jgi:hypothetical protein